MGLKYVDEFRSRKASRALASRIAAGSERVGRQLKFMEVCGTHTMAVFRHGLLATLPDCVKLLSGPGCPVCVTPISYVDHAIALSRLRDVTIATFGDMMRVPGSVSSLEKERPLGADIRVAYSPLDALEAAKAEPSRMFVFLAVGFETTAPLIASCVMKAEEQGIDNFRLLTAHKTVPPAMRALAESRELALDGFLCPAHVSAVIGTKAYESLVSEFGIPCVVAGFEPLDILMGLELLVGQLASGRSEVENQYTRVVKPEGNPYAREALYTVFEPADANWRGLGLIPGSGLAIRDGFSHRDAARTISVEVEEPVEPEGCRCGDVLRGVLEPPGCPLFAERCTPRTPVGACMVSSEGTCAAHYKYRRGISYES